MSLRIASPSVVFQRYLFVREVGGPNRGAFVQAFQRHTGNQPGDSYCASAVCYVLDRCYAGQSPLIKTGSCAELLEDARKKGYRVVPGTPAQIDDLFFYLDEHGHAHHTGVITGVPAGSRLIGIAGNTSEDGTSSDGTGVFNHALNPGRGSMVLVRLPA